MPALPPAFRSFPAFGALNVAAVGLSLGAIVSLPASLDGGPEAPCAAAALGLPTVLVGVVWARGLRSRSAGGWGVSVGLAWLNSTMIGGLGPILHRSSFEPWPLSSALGALVGATVGAFVWIPALLVTLLLFGVPIAQARKLARRGFSGAERGEAIIGGASAAIGSFALFAAASSASNFASALLTCALGLSGAAAGGVASGLALAREMRRRRFVRRVEAGEAPGYRLEDTPDGRGLLRVPSGHAYRERDVLVAILTKESAVTQIV